MWVEHHALLSCFAQRRIYYRASPIHRFFAARSMTGACAPFITVFWTVRKSLARTTHAIPFADDVLHCEMQVREGAAELHEAVFKSLPGGRLSGKRRVLDEIIGNILIGSGHIPGVENLGVELASDSFVTLDHRRPFGGCARRPGRLPHRGGKGCRWPTASRAHAGQGDRHSARCTALPKCLVTLLK